MGYIKGTMPHPNADMHHVYCAAEHKKCREEHSPWSCICDLMDKYAPTDKYVELLIKHEKRIEYLS